MEGVSNYNCYLLIITTNTNTAQGHLWNRSTTSGNTLGINLVEIDVNGAQSGTLYGIR